MKRATLLILLAYGLTVLGLDMRSSDLILLAIPLLVYAGVALYGRPDPPQVSVNRAVSAAIITKGQQVTVETTLVNEGKRAEKLLVEDILPARVTLLAGANRAMTILAPGEALTLQYTIQAPRGSFNFTGLKVTSLSGLGPFQRQGRVQAETRLISLPHFRRLRQIAIRPLLTSGFSGPIPARQGGAGVDFFSVREYQPGDPFRRINWKTLARHENVLYTNEFEQERVADVGLILDTRQRCNITAGGESLMEYAIATAAALADALLRDGHRVGLLLYGGNLEWVFPGYGKGQQARILRALAEVKAADRQIFQSLRYLPTRLFPARSQLLFVSPLLAEDEKMLFRLRSNGYSLLLVSPDPVDFEAREFAGDPLLPWAQRLARLERELLLQRLRQGGIDLVNWPVEQTLDGLLHAALRQRSHVINR